MITLPTNTVSEQLFRPLLFCVSVYALASTSSICEAKARNLCDIDFATSVSLESYGEKTFFLFCCCVAQLAQSDFLEGTAFKVLLLVVCTTLIHPKKKCRHK